MEFPNIRSIPINRFRDIYLSERTHEDLRSKLTVNIDNISRITQNAGNAITRLAFTNTETLAMKYIEQNAIKYGLDNNSYDSFGNFHCVLEGTKKDLPRIIVGSHLDSVINAGKYDGVTGVVGGLEALRIIKTTDYKNENTLELIAFRGEESTRFNKALLGSSLLLGSLAIEELSKIKDRDNISILDAMKMEKIFPSSSDIIDPDNVLAYLEMHIEQSSYLYKNNLDLGIVSCIAAPERYEITVTGESLHSGTTAMDERNDPICAAADLATSISNFGMDALYEGRRSVATVGYFNSFGGSMNQTAGTVIMGLDVRDSDMTYRSVLVNKIKEYAKKIEDATKKEEDGGIKITFELKDKKAPAYTSSDINKLLARSARFCNIKYEMIPSLAGHDAMVFAQAGIPTGMLFIPSQEGISHNPLEYSNDEHIFMATKVLIQSLVNISAPK